MKKKNNYNNQNQNKRRLKIYFKKNYQSVCLINYIKLLLCFLNQQTVLIHMYMHV